MPNWRHHPHPLLAAKEAELRHARSDFAVKYPIELRPEPQCGQRGKSRGRQPRTLREGGQVGGADEEAAWVCREMRVSHCVSRVARTLRLIAMDTFLILSVPN